MNYITLFNYLVNFFASWCAPCRIEAPVVEELSKFIPIIGIAYKDNAKDNKKFFGTKIKENHISKLQKNSVNFHNIYGYGETFSTTYELFTGKNIYKSY